MATRIVVEWTRETLRVALSEGIEARCRIRAVHSQPIAPAGTVGDALRGLLKTAKTPEATVIGVIPREQVITRLVKFPTTDAGELAQMVELYAKAQLPYPREQTVLDFHVLKQEDGFSAVAVIACQRDVINRHLTALREAGLSPALLTLSSWGVLGWYRKVRAQASQQGTADEPCLVVNVDDARTDLVVIGEDRILSSRSIGQGAADWADAGEAAELLQLEVERSRTAIQKELPGTDVRSLLLTGLGALPQWREQLAQRLGLPALVVESKQPLKGWVGPMATPASPVVIGGLACSGMEGLLNLNPPDVRTHVAHRRKVHELVTVSALLLGVLALGAGLLAMQAVRERRLAVRLERALTQVEPAAKLAQAKTRSTQLVGFVLEGRRRLAANLVGVFDSTPADMTLETLTFERARREVVVRGNAASNQTVLDYIARLEHLDGVTNVQLKYSTRRSGAAGERTDFELAFHQREPS